MGASKCPAGKLPTRLCKDLATRVVSVLAPVSNDNANSRYAVVSDSPEARDVAFPLYNANRTQLDCYMYVIDW